MKGQSLSAKVAKQKIVDEPVTVTVGRGRPVGVHTVSAVVHLTIMHARRAQLVAGMRRLAEAGLLTWRADAAE